MKIRRNPEDTIVAIATPAGDGGIGIVRLSGDAALSVAEALFRPAGPGGVRDLRDRTVSFGRVVETAPAGRQTVDEALLVLMRGPRSYTGQDVVEIQAHGSQAVLRKIVDLALEAGARLAEPGEFTERAFLNGRMDLLQAEAVLDLVQARTERARRWAVSQMEGALSRKLKVWKEELLAVLSHLEASVDFPDDLPDTEPVGRLLGRLERILSEADRLLGDSELAFIAKRGFRVALWGRPNVGKSSLLNRLVRSDRVIVTPYPGTTRDVVEEEISLGGFPVRFQDTAGVRETEHPIEKEGVERSRKAAAAADLVLWVFDASEDLDQEDCALLADLAGCKGLAVLNKSDRPSRLDERTLRTILPAGWPVVRSSCLEERGVEALEQKILALILGGRSEEPLEALLTSARQKDLLEKVLKDLSQAVEACRQNCSEELITPEIRSALDYLGEMVGEVYNEDVLEAIFSQFCIGK